MVSSTDVSRHYIGWLSPVVAEFVTWQIRLLCDTGAWLGALYKSYPSYVHLGGIWLLYDMF